MRQTAFTLLPPLVLATALSGVAPSPHRRFEREVLQAADTGKYVLITRDGIQELAIRSDEHTVACLLYRDAAKYYVEITIRNQSGHDLTIGDDLIGIEQDGRDLKRIHTEIAVAQLDTNTRKAFAPVAPRIEQAYIAIFERLKKNPDQLLVRVANDELKLESPR